MTFHDNKITRQADFPEKRENAMRPSRYLGYDHDRLGVYFMEKEAFAIAEVEFRRAVWLNPFEADFKAHLAVCLIRRNRPAEAEHLVRQVQETQPDHRDVENLLRLISRTEDP